IRWRIYRPSIHPEAHPTPIQPKARREPMRQRRRLAVALSLCTALGLTAAACGSDNSSSSSGGATTAASTATTAGATTTAGGATTTAASGGGATTTAAG